MYCHISKDNYEHRPAYQSDSTRLGVILSQLAESSSPKYGTSLSGRLSTVTISTNKSYSHASDELRHTSPSIESIEEHVDQGNANANPLATIIQSSQQPHAKHGEHHHGSAGSGLGSFKIHRKSGEKITENLLWNLSIIKTELDSLYGLRADCQAAFKQVSVACFIVKIVSTCFRFLFRCRSNESPSL